MQLLIQAQPIFPFIKTIIARELAGSKIYLPGTGIRFYP